MFNSTFPAIQPQTLAVKLTAKGERSVRSGHPWIFSESVEKINKEGKSGDIAVIFSHTKNKAMGVGLYDAQSPIVIKMLHHDGGARLDEAFFRNKINRAYALRVDLLETETNSYRLLFGENDGFPGLIADVYAEVLVVKLYSAIWLPYLETIFKLLIEISKTKTAVLRLSRTLQHNENFLLTEGTVVYGNLPSETVYFKEHGVNFSANVIKGHKTGYFLDHRDNRKRVGVLSINKSVLDVFSYAGGFSVHALAKGAKEVTSVDISEQALELAKANSTLNEQSGNHTTLVGDAFEIMKQLIHEQKRFDVVVIDPPSFAKRQKEIPVAKKKYAQLAQLGEKLTARGGLLVLASCSSRIPATDFFKINKEALKKQPRHFSVQLKTGHDIDHPVTFPEGAYLKCGYYKFQE
ncbi:class I SAM-dependent rRNA methyltransferase [Marinirhabdus gelatinilytica]|uniref:23S rRNA (Cytosine1962-C5)-methyltransferase n=1 Tax=Marinirhabdus gelatinilytica TaxID=1703343 RepID=A0A370QA08_9FLAO|nr:class I SAM-dependent rRNA methyltransferase [Marinirhabdus gelatinilytica]RDK85206.1 23S rRNA (cytosine1962-C5)-methyltransferase [Marinirhabdus gelatinilytica]